MEPRAHWSVAQRACLDMAWLVFGLPNRLRVEGRDRVPGAGGVLVIANHFSLLDPIFLSLAMPRPVRYLVKPLPPGFEPVQAVYDTYGCIATSTGRGLARAMAQAADLVRAGSGLAIFPEGGVSPDGRLQSFQTGAARVALSTGCPVVPAWIEGAYEALPAGRTMPRLGRVTVRFGPAVRLHGRPQAAHRSHDLNRATMVLRQAVQSLAPRSGKEPSC